MSLSYQNGKLEHGYINELSLEFEVTTMLTISKIWKDVHAQLKAGKLINVARKYKGTKSTRFIDVEKVKSIELKDRMCLKDLAFGLGLPITTIWKLVQKGEMKCHTSDIRSSLTTQNKITRLQWVVGKISASSLRGNLVFDAMYDVVHIDEKHFYMTRTTTRYYLLPNEQKPHRTCQLKRFINKFMFMATVARPRYSDDGVVYLTVKLVFFHLYMKWRSARIEKRL
ncbi:hypothetical protein RND81_07G028700 [Saponaria officinalis]|uniref:Transposase n=1 Tax=Saponaria officinalis TaxID=3572 RepID=A0AAW1JLT0_SAPOF